MAIPKKLNKPTDKEIEDRVESALKDASTKKTTPVELKPKKVVKADKAADKKKIGRPKKSVDEVLSEKILISITKEERAKLEGKANIAHGVVLPLPTLVRALLKENGII